MRTILLVVSAAASALPVLRKEHRTRRHDLAVDEEDEMADAPSFVEVGADGAVSPPLTAPQLAEFEGMPSAEVLAQMKRLKKMSAKERREALAALQKSGGSWESWWGQWDKASVTKGLDEQEAITNKGWWYVDMMNNLIRPAADEQNKAAANARAATHLLENAIGDGLAADEISKHIVNNMGRFEDRVVRAAAPDTTQAQKDIANGQNNANNAAATVASAYKLAVQTLEEAKAMEQMSIKAYQIAEQGNKYAAKTYNTATKAVDATAEAARIGNIVQGTVSTAKDKVNQAQADVEKLQASNDNIVKAMRVEDQANVVAEAERAAAQQEAVTDSALASKLVNEILPEATLKEEQGNAAGQVAQAKGAEAQAKALRARDNAQDAREGATNVLGAASATNKGASDEVDRGTNTLEKANTASDIAGSAERTSQEAKSRAQRASDLAREAGNQVKQSTETQDAAEQVADKALKLANIDEAKLQKLDKDSIDEVREANEDREMVNNALKQVGVARKVASEVQGEADTAKDLANTALRQAAQADKLLDMAKGHDEENAKITAVTIDTIRKSHERDDFANAELDRTDRLMAGTNALATNIEQAIGRETAKLEASQAALTLLEKKEIAMLEEVVSLSKLESKTNGADNELRARAIAQLKLIPAMKQDWTRLETTQGKMDELLKNILDHEDAEEQRRASLNAQMEEDNRARQKHSEEYERLRKVLQGQAAHEDRLTRETTRQGVQQEQILGVVDVQRNREKRLSKSVEAADQLSKQAENDLAQVLARQNTAATQYDDLASKQQGIDEDVLSISATQAEHARTMDGIDSHHANLKSTIQRVERSQREMNGDLNVLNDESGVLKKTLDDIDLNAKNLRRADGVLAEVQSKVNTTLSDLQADLDRDTAVANTLKEDSRVLEERRADQAEAQIPREARIKDYESLVQKNGEKLAAVDSGFKVVSESASQHSDHLNELLHGIDNLRSDQLMANATLHAVSRLETAQEKTLDLLYNVQNKTHRELMTAHHTMEGLSALESAIETDMPAQMHSVAAAQRVQAGLKEAMVAMRDAVSSDTTNAKGLQDKVKTVRKQVEELVEGQRNIDNVIGKAQDTQNGLNIPSMKGSGPVWATAIGTIVALSII